MNYVCEAQCGATFAHPDVEECPSIDGMCAHLMGAGWRPVYVRIFPEQLTSERIAGARSPRWTENELLLARGGWMCPGCVEKTRRR